MNALADAHIHLFRNGYKAQGAADQEMLTYAALRSSHGIEAAVVVGYEGDPRYAGNNDYIVELGHRHDWVYPVCYLPTSVDPGPDALRAARRAGFVGYSLYLDEVDTSLDLWSEESLEVLQRGSIISVNASPAALARCADTLGRMTEAVVLISHLGLPGAGSQNSTQAMRPLLGLSRFEHVFVKVSGAYAIDPAYPHFGASTAVNHALTAFGAERLLWGSDYPPALEYCTPEQVLEPPVWLNDLLDESQIDLVLGGNLKRIVAAVRP